MTTLVRTIAPVVPVTAIVAGLVIIVSVMATASQPGAGPPDEELAPADPLADTPVIGAEVTGPSASREIATMLPPRTDSPLDWEAGLEPLHVCGEPRWLPPCIPPPPCHPACPPQPFDLIGVDGMPTRGPRYRGPCCPHGTWAWWSSWHGRRP